LFFFSPQGSGGEYVFLIRGETKTPKKKFLPVWELKKKGVCWPWEGGVFCSSVVFYNWVRDKSRELIFSKQAGLPGGGGGGDALNLQAELFDLFPIEKKSFLAVGGSKRVGIFSPGGILSTQKKTFCGAFPRAQPWRAKKKFAFCPGEKKRGGSTAKKREKTKKITTIGGGGGGLLYGGGAGAPAFDPKFFSPI